MKSPIWLPAGLVVAAIVFGLPLCRRAIILSDEGYLLQQALDLLGGRVLYRDMDAFITPGMWFLLAGLFAVIEPSVLASRMLILLAYGALALVSYRIVAPISGRGTAVASVAGLLLFSVWAFPAWTFAFYSPVAVLLALFALERLLAWQRGRLARDLFLVGLLLGLSICFKQNYGVFALLGAALGWLAIRLDERGRSGSTGVAPVREVGLVAAGTIVAGLPFLAYLVLHGALPDAWQSLVVHPFEFGGMHDIPFAPLSDLWKTDLYSSGVDKLTYLSYASLQTGPISLLHSLRVVRRLHVLAYWLPLVFLIAGAVLALAPRREREGRVDTSLLALVAVAGGVFMGVMPRADFNHLVNVYQPILVLAPVVAQRAFAALPRRPAIWRRGLAALLAGLALAYGGIAIHWYGVLLRHHNTELSQRRGGVLVVPPEAESIDHQVRTIQRMSRSGEAVLTLPDISMLNFLAERPVPSAYYNLYEHHISADQGAAVVDGAEASGVELVIARYDNFFSDRRGLLEYAPVLTDYLISHFERVFVAGNEGFIVYKRAPRPRRQLPFVDPLLECEAGSALAEVRRHLLFSALYHKSQINDPMPPEGLQTHCRTHVPEQGGELSFELGYRTPHRAKSGTRLKAQIDVVAGSGTERVLDTSLRVVRRQAINIQHPYQRIELDLSRWAGQPIELVFQTRLVGSVVVNPLDFKGFAMVWRDLRIQSGGWGARP